MLDFKDTYTDFSDSLSVAISNISDERIAQYIAEYQENELINIQDLLPQDLWDQLAAETQALMEGFGKRHDVEVVQSENSKRTMTTVGNKHCRQHAPCMSAIYDSEDFLGLLSQIAGERVNPYPNPVEQLAVSLLTEPHDTHGWHWDEGSFAAIWMIECPPASYGGFTQFIPRTRHERGNISIYEVLTKYPLLSRYFPQGSIYFFRSGSALHRVHPLVKPARRLIINMDFVSDSDLERDLDASSTEAFIDS